MVKSWFKSKTLWANFLMFLIIIFQQLGVAPAVADPQTQGIAIVIINTFLRVITKQPIGK